ncbi:iron-regulated protein [Putridiphycobacter roseus]|uniref:Iron-regulated protein n=1 Tax=Putridiphycobacter roseus TaxID=2219161 RepID=A0A2W1NM95_9FLAO|nr:ChaN family lipoprotein [Putridiphycobacter roseus]PZE18976.1 iron-regulated protein [Putridiphycobacter roseus]
MKLIFVLFLSLTSFFTNAKTIEAFKIYNQSGKEISFDKVLKVIKTKSYIFFGEYHNNAVSHWLELELTQHLYTLHQQKLVLGAEMFEADNQYILNEYLSGYISPRNFQNEMRLWENYNTDYKPMVEFAKDKGLKFIATNIPRRYANMVYKKGMESLDQLSEMAKSFIAPLSDFKFDSTVTCYKEMIEMEHGGIGMAKAQAMKDATMAYFILKNANPQTVFLHFNGSYHSNNYEGIIHYLKQRVDLAQIANFTTVTQENIDTLESENIGLADFIICVKSNFTNTH